MGQIYHAYNPISAIILLYFSHYHHTRLFCCLTDCVLSVCSGSVWVYSVYPPSYTQGNSRYCNKISFQFAFVITTLVWVFLTLVFTCGCCCGALACCKAVRVGRRLIPSRNTFYGGTGYFEEPIVSEAWVVKIHCHASTIGLTGVKLLLILVLLCCWDLFLLFVLALYMKKKCIETQIHINIVISYCGLLIVHSAFFNCMNFASK